MVANKTERLFSTVNLITFLWGLPNFWIEDIKLPKLFLKIHKYFMLFLAPVTFAYIIFEFGAFYTQKNLTDKQEGDRMLLPLSHFIIYFYLNFVKRNTNKIRYLMTTLAVTLKKKYNDEEVERQMIRKVKVTLVALLYICSMSLVSYGVAAALHYVKGEGTFTTVITAWPDVADRSTPAHITRVIAYLWWWILMTRVFAAFFVLMLIVVSLGCQYKNLCSYFSGLGAIFEDDSMSQSEKEFKYEEAFKVGIKMHAETLRCVNLGQKSCNGVYTGQMMMNTSVLAIIMFQMVQSERTVSNVLAVVMAAMALLVSTGLFMLAAGDITEEAAKLDIAMYCSGWENCYGKSSRRIKKLLVLSMMLAQRRVVMRSFSLIEISYQSYLYMVKSSYSVFSVLY